MIAAFLTIFAVWLLGAVGVFVFGMLSRSREPETREIETVLVIVATVAWPAAIPYWLWKKLKRQ